MILKHKEEKKNVFTALDKNNRKKKDSLPGFLTKLQCDLRQANAQEMWLSGPTSYLLLLGLLTSNWYLTESRLWLS